MAEQPNMGLAMPTDPEKMSYIVAYCNELERKIAVLSNLAGNGFEDEALTLALVYIDGLAQRLCWPSEANGPNFVHALIAHSKDPELGLVHPGQLAGALDWMKATWHSVAAAVRAAFPGPDYELLPKATVVAALKGAFTKQQLFVHDMEPC